MIENTREFEHLAPYRTEARDGSATARRAGAVPSTAAVMSREVRANSPREVFFISDLIHRIANHMRPRYRLQFTTGQTRDVEGFVTANSPHAYWLFESEDIDEYEAEAKAIGVPTEYYLVEGVRRAIWRALKVREDERREQEARDIAYRHHAAEKCAGEWVEKHKKYLDGRRAAGAVRSTWGNQLRAGKEVSP